MTGRPRGNLRALDIGATGGTTPPQTTERAPAGPGQGTAARPVAATRPHPATDRSRLILVGLLLVIVTAGLRSGVALTWERSWRGPWYDRAHGVALAVALELICAGLLSWLLVRRRHSPGAASLPGRLRVALIRLVVVVMLALGGALLTLLHLHFKPGKPRSFRALAGGHVRRRRVPVTSSGNIELSKDLAIALIVLVLLVLLVYLLRRLRWRDPVGTPVPLVDDESALRAAVEAGRMALGELSEPRMAIIRCYLAMESSLARAGTGRTAAETPDELLGRSIAAGLLHGSAPAELTGLFYEARFSTHPVPQSSRDRALRALDEILADLGARPAPGGPEPAGSAARS
jgi:uncharacterized protein DUF4129